MSDITVTVLAEGAIRKECGCILEAHSTSTLIEDGNFKIVVDTSSREYREKILARLKELGIRCDEIDVVVITHLHHDHCSNNDLFVNAQFIAHVAENPPSHYRVIDENHKLSPSVEIVHTPGHTPGSASVFVNASSKTAITGDALPTRDNYIRWIPPGINYDYSLSLHSMKRIVEFANVVVPGHDRPFHIDR
ncbi:MAG: MBL fold metallo-hydrolase [Methanomassiliicoccales archaeon]